MGKSSTSIAFATVLGPLSAGFMASALGYKAVFLLSASMMLVMFFVFFVFARKVSETQLDDVDAIDDSIPTGRHFLRVAYLPLAVAYVGALAMTIGKGALVTHLPTWVLVQGAPGYCVGILFATFAAVGWP